MDNEANEATYSLRCIPNQYTAKKVHLALCFLINCRTCLTNRDSILVLISTILSPPSAYVFNSDSLFKASGLLFQRKVNANLFNYFPTFFGIDVRLPIYQIELHNTVCSITLFPINDNCLLLYRFTHFSNLEMTFPQVLLSAPVVPMYTP